jgi:hypothetical protein
MKDEQLRHIFTAALLRAILSPIRGRRSFIRAFVSGKHRFNAVQEVMMTDSHVDTVLRI